MRSKLIYPIVFTSFVLLGGIWLHVTCNRSPLGNFNI